MPDNDLDLQPFKDRNQPCPRCEYEERAAACICRGTDPRVDVWDLIGEVERLRSRTSIGPDSERIRELEAEVEKYKGALDEIDRMNPDDFRTGQSHLSPAFREVNFRAAFAHVCRIVNRTLHGIDSTAGPRR